MSTTDDLVADLLAAIERLETKADAASKTGLAFVWARRNGRATMQDWLAEVANPDHVLRLCRAHRDIVAMFPVSEPHVDTHGSFYGFQSRDCGEHRTVGPHRAWCFDCSEWCYPEEACRRCHGVSEVLRILARGYGVEDA